MDFKFDEEQQLLQQVTNKYALTRLAPEADRWKNEPFAPEIVKELGDLGILGMRVPAEYGGSKASFVAMGIAAEELARGDFNVSYFLQLSAIAAKLLDGADEEIKQQWLPAIASGDSIVAFALTEPGVGSDAANLTCSARRDGDDWIVNGEKSSITFAGSADGCVVFCRTGGPGARGISMIFVPLDLPGVSRTKYASAGGHLSERGSLFFDDVRVPANHQIGVEGTGFIGAMEAFDFNRAIIALAAIGTASQSLDETIEYTKTRETFGQPLAKREGVAFQIAEHLALLHATRLLSYEVLALADAGLPHTSEAAMCKWLGPKQSVEAIHACLLLHGWTGYGTDLPFVQRLNDVMGLEVGDGTPEIMKAIIAREAFGREFSSYK
ncbi:MAG: acyl-CoA dehydrogenase family protein [Ilumatobacter sp.]|uniref:acyl-CoA dehydrogenase family protein n=1 Tax=Ilumatobacter sp. TaxID=1967498 RepID=UPI0039188CAA